MSLSRKQIRMKSTSNITTLRNIYINVMSMSVMSTDVIYLRTMSDKLSSSGGSLTQVSPFTGARATTTSRGQRTDTTLSSIQRIEAVSNQRLLRQLRYIILKEQQGFDPPLRSKVLQITQYPWTYNCNMITMLLER